MPKSFVFFQNKNKQVSFQRIIKHWHYYLEVTSHKLTRKQCILEAFVVCPTKQLLNTTTFDQLDALHTHWFNSVDCPYCPTPKFFLLLCKIIQWHSIWLQILTIGSTVQEKKKANTSQINHEWNTAVIVHFVYLSTELGSKMPCHK